MTARTYYNWDRPPNYYEFLPSDLIVAGDGGFWYDFGDWDYMFTDTAMTTKVTSAGQSVAAVKDRGPNGYHLLQGNAAARPVSGQSGAFKFLDFTPNQFLETNSPCPMALTPCHGYIIFECDSNANFTRLLSTSTEGTANDTSNSQSIAIHTSDTTAHFGVRGLAAAIETKVGGTGNSPFGLYEYEVNGANASSWYNGSVGIVDGSASGLAAKGVGRIIVGVMSADNVATTSGPLDGRIWNIVHLGTLPSGASNTQLKNWLNVNRY